MRISAAVALLFASADAKQCPLTKIVDMLQGLQARMDAEEVVETQQFNEYSKWCNNEGKDKNYAIETGKAHVADLSAELEDLNAGINSMDTQVSELASAITKNEADLQAARKIRSEEKVNFQKTDKELTDAIDELVRAASILRRVGHEGSAGSTAKFTTLLTQVAAGLSTVMNAASIDVADKRKLSSLLESSSDDDDFNPPTGAPQAAAYESHSTSIVDTLAELKVKAENERADLRRDEMSKKHNFEMLAQSLTDQVSTQNRDMSSSKATKAQKEEAKGIASGDLSESQKTLANDEEYLSDLERMCEEKSVEWDQRQTDRAKEMSALSKALAFIQSDKFKSAVESRITAHLGADAAKSWSKDYNSRMLVQITTSVSTTTLNKDVRSRIAELLQATANRVHSTGLAQLAIRTRAGDDPFVKVRGLISGMISKLTAQQASESDAKAFCDTETASSTQKRDKLSNTVDNLDTRVDQATAGIAQLKEQIATLSTEVADMDKDMAEATALRQKENAAWVKAQQDWKVGIEAVSVAIETLQEYFSKGQTSFVQVPQFGGEVFSGKYETHDDAAGGIIAMLEQALAMGTQYDAASKAAESSAQTAYDKMKKDFDINRAMKTTAVQNKEQEVARVTNLVGDLKSDRAGSQSELDAVLEYLSKLKLKCEHKPMSFGERAARRKQEIDSLKQALDILETEVAPSSLLQRGRKHQ